jgi:hypothetical protein
MARDNSFSALIIIVVSRCRLVQYSRHGSRRSQCVEMARVLLESTPALHAAADDGRR